MTNTRDKASRVDVQKSLGLLVRVNFDVLVLQALELHSNPYTLNEGARMRVSAKCSEDFNVDAIKKILTRSSFRIASTHGLSSAF
jgi:hypothetical protein